MFDLFKKPDRSSLEELSNFLTNTYEDAKPFSLTKTHGFLCAVNLHAKLTPLEAKVASKIDTNKKLLDGHAAQNAARHDVCFRDGANSPIHAS